MGLNFRGYLLSGAVTVFRKIIWVGTPLGRRKVEGAGGIIICGPLLVTVRNFHLINNLSTNKLNRSHYQTKRMNRTKTYRIDIQIRSPSVLNPIRDGHRMGPSTEIAPREKNLLELIRTPIPIIEKRFVVEGDIVLRMVTPLGAVNPDRGPIEGY